jgi:RNA-directed DNA polymerase
MQESYGEGVATHTGPESCVAGRKDGDEALTGERAGRPLNREINNPPQGGHSGVPTHLSLCGRPHPRRRQRKTPWDPARSETPRMYGNIPHGNRESRRMSAQTGRADRIGKSTDARR